MRIEKAFEGLLGNSRRGVVVAVVASLLVAFATFYVASVDVMGLLSHLRAYGDLGMSDEARAAAHTTFVTHVVGIVDGYPLGALMLIFSLGLSELFVSRCHAAEGSGWPARTLLTRGVDGREDRQAERVTRRRGVGAPRQALGRGALAPGTEERPGAGRCPDAGGDEESEGQQHQPDECRVSLVESEFVAGVGSQAESGR